jgi:hypothetical protein
MGVEFDFDDGSKQAVAVGPRPIAELTARDRVGDQAPIIPHIGRDKRPID